MTYRFLASLGVAAVVAVAGTWVTVAAQGQPTPTTPNPTGSAGRTLEDHRELVRILRAHIDPEGEATWVPPRTRWGEPDLQGHWTSDAVHGVPRARPAHFGTRAFLNDEELAERAAREEQTRQNAFAASSPNTSGRDRAWRGHVTFPIASMIVDPPDGQIPALTSDAQNRRIIRGTWADTPHLHESPEDFTLYDRCITRGIVGSLLPVSYGNGNMILQTPGQFVITYEMIHDTRIIPLDGRPRLGSDLRQYLGSSRGRWEGDTLVVETTNLTDRTSIGGNGNGLRHTDAMHMVERFTRLTDDYLLYEVTMDDPGTYERPWTLVVPLVSPPGFRILPYECHEANGAVSYTLSGAREYDRAVTEALARGLPPPEPPPTAFPPRED